jgi:hypothetical protein
MNSATRTQRTRRIAALALVPVAAIVLGACGPTPAPAPAPAPTSAPAPTQASATVNSQGARTWPSSGTKQYPPAPTNCTGSYSDAVESCHLTYKFYKLDTTNPQAQTMANRIATMTHAQCQNALATFHSGTGFNPTLQSQYPNSTLIGENLYCSYYSNENLCPSAQLGAQNAINGWLASPPHHATMDQFAGMWVNAAAVCKPLSQGGHGVYVAVAQFHNNP